MTVLAQKGKIRIASDALDEALKGQMVYVPGGVVMESEEQILVINRINRDGSIDAHIENAKSEQKIGSGLQNLTASDKPLETYPFLPLIEKVRIKVVDLINEDPIYSDSTP